MNRDCYLLLRKGEYRIQACNPVVMPIDGYDGWRIVAGPASKHTVLAKLVCSVVGEFLAHRFFNYLLIYTDDVFCRCTEAIPTDREATWEVMRPEYVGGGRWEITYLLIWNDTPDLADVYVVSVHICGNVGFRLARILGIR